MTPQLRKDKRSPISRLTAAEYGWMVRRLEALIPYGWDEQRKRALEPTYAVLRGRDLRILMTGLAVGEHGY